MSHFSTVKTKMGDFDCALGAIEDLGYTVERADEGVEITVAEYSGDGGNVVAVIRMDQGYDIGIRHETVTSFVADWWGVKGITKAKFLDDVSQKYSHKKVKSELLARGYTVSKEETEKDGTIRMQVRRFDA